MNIFNILAGAIGQGIQKGAQAFPSILGQAKQTYQNFMTDLPANSAYIQSRIASRFLPKEPLLTYEDTIAQKNIQQNYEKMNDPQRLYADLQNPLAFENFATKSHSAKINSYPTSQPNAQVEALRMKILNNGNYRPAMSRYLTTVPIQEMPQFQNQPPQGVTYVGGPQNIYNTYGPNEIPANFPPPNSSWETSYGGVIPSISMTRPVTPQDASWQQPILTHELAHASPRNMAFKQDFIDFFKNLDPKKQPLLYNVALTYRSNGQLPPNPEEFYATVSQQLGARALAIPEIRKYYENVFTDFSQKNSEYPLLSEPAPRLFKIKK